MLQAFGLHNHQEAGADDGHAHNEEERGEELTVVWRSCVVILGTYAFFLFEYILHSWTAHSHSIPYSSSHSSTNDVSVLYCL